MKKKAVILTSIILVISFLSGCSVLDYQSTKTEQRVDEVTTDALQVKVAELEKRIKVLEDKLQGQW